MSATTTTQIAAATAQIEAAIAQIKAAEKQIEAAQGQIEAAKAQIKAATAQIDAAEANRETTDNKDDQEDDSDSNQNSSITPNINRTPPPRRKTKLDLETFRRVCEAWNWETSSHEQHELIVAESLIFDLTSGVWDEQRCPDARKLGIRAGVERALVDILSGAGYGVGSNGAKLICCSSPDQQCKPLPEWLPFGVLEFEELEGNVMAFIPE